MIDSPDKSDGLRSPIAQATKCWGLLTRKMAWRFSSRGWLCLGVLLALASWGAVLGIHPFLAVNAPIGADVLVIEAWVPNYVLKEGMDAATLRNCRFVLLTGGTMKGDLHPDPGDTYPRVAAVRLKDLGINTERVRVVESVTPTRDRTYSSAVAVRKWLAREGVKADKINVLTLGPHARRSRLLFQKAMGSDVKVGIISTSDREYDANHWWRYSEGVKEVLSEGAAYLYARFLFHP